MSDRHIEDVAHLMRRAGFGLTGLELQSYVGRSYDEILEDILHPERFPATDNDIYDRYQGTVDEHEVHSAGLWIHRMVHTQRPLEEKIALFWHHVFATGMSKGEHRHSSNRQIDMFRRVGLGDFRTILLELSMDPAMLYWLDNNENHKDQPNENYGRELLELFSMGVGHYSEQDIKMAARAFTGWTFKQPIPQYTQGSYPAEFVFIESDHDDSEKTFLGETGRFNGQDIIDIIVKQPATARFICRHLYNFFVADEPQVPAWNQLPPGDSRAIDIMTEAFKGSGGEIRAVLRVMFSSDFFKQAKLRRVKSPAELVAGVLKLVQTEPVPASDITRYSAATTFMGQILHDPPSVEGWHTGHEWIDGGTLTERVNFAVDELADKNRNGVRKIIEALETQGESLSPSELVDRSAMLIGALHLDSETRRALIEDVSVDGDLSLSNLGGSANASDRIVSLLQSLVSCREYQFA